MNLFRLTYYRRFFITFWCVTVVNMNFYLAEIKALKNTDKTLIENVKKLLSTVAEEEDTESTGKSAPVAEDLLVHNQRNQISRLKEPEVKMRLYAALAANLHKGFLEISAPPPEA